MLSSVIIFCLIITYGAAQDTLTHTERWDIFMAHDYYRRRVWGGASNMRTLQWSECLEQMAERDALLCLTPTQYANRNLTGNIYGCKPSGHIGQNSYWAPGPITNISKVVEYWYSESSEYDIFGNFCFTECAEFLQVVWAETYKIGCGKRYCSVDNVGTHLLCYYLPGSQPNQRPYILGSNCMRCPLGWYYCNEGMCDFYPEIEIM